MKKPILILQRAEEFFFPFFRELKKEENHNEAIFSTVKLLSIFFSFIFLQMNECMNFPRAREQK